MTEVWRNPDVLFCSCGQEFHSMDEAGNHWDQFNDHTIKDRSDNVHFRSVKDTDPAEYEELNEIRGEWECRCGRKFDRLGDMQMHLNVTHYMVKSKQYSLFPEAEKHRAELRERKARGETFEPDPDFSYECTCGAIFFSVEEGILHMDENPMKRESSEAHLISGRHYGHKYVCDCGEEFAVELRAKEHLAANIYHNVVKNGPQGSEPLQWQRPSGMSKYANKCSCGKRFTTQEDALRHVACALKHAQEKKLTVKHELATTEESQNS